MLESDGMTTPSTRFGRVRLGGSAPLLPHLADFYGDRLGLGLSLRKGRELAVEVGESVLEFDAVGGSPFYHFALLGPGNRFGEMLEWAGERVKLLPERKTGDVVFDFAHWDAKACYFHDPSGNIVELIAHRAVGEARATGAFTAGELLGVSEIGLVGDPPALAGALERELGLEVWSGTVTGERSLAFVGEQARTLILCRPGRPWLPTTRPAEAHPVAVVLAGQAPGEGSLEGGGRGRSSGNSMVDRPSVTASRSFRYVPPGG